MPDKRLSRGSWIEEMEPALESSDDHGVVRRVALVTVRAGITGFD